MRAHHPCELEKIFSDPSPSPFWFRQTSDDAAFPMGRVSHPLRQPQVDLPRVPHSVGDLSRNGAEAGVEPGGGCVLAGVAGRDHRGPAFGGGGPSLKPRTTTSGTAGGVRFGLIYASADEAALETTRPAWAFSTCKGKAITENGKRSQTQTDFSHRAYFPPVRVY